MRYPNHEARLNITWQGQNGDLPDTVSYHASDKDILRWAAEAIRGGDVAGIHRQRDASLEGFVVDRFPASAQVPYARVFVRPKTPFG
jgi:uncharacterized protein (DUF2236 family)